MLIKGTYILTPKGNVKIENLKTNDTIKCSNIFTNNKYGSIKSIKSKDCSKFIALILKNNYHIITSPTQKLYLSTDEYKNAEELSPQKDYIINYKGKAIKLLNKTTIYKDCKAYSIKVKKFQNCIANRLRIA